MGIGKIIKMNRLMKGLTQAELCQGICSITHLSKIENEFTKVSYDTIKLLCQRLKIELEKEQEKIESISSTLDNFYDAIAFENKTVIKMTYEYLEENSFYIRCTHLSDKYDLFLFRYYLFMGQLEEAHHSYEKISRKKKELGRYEKNLFFHFTGVYFLLKYQEKVALDCLLQVEIEEHSSPEIYYHLGWAYYLNNLMGSASYYFYEALKAFQCNKQLNRVLECKAMLIVQLDQFDTNGLKILTKDFQTKLAKTENQFTQSILLFVMGYSYLKVGGYEKAKHYLKKSLEKNIKKQYHYLINHYLLTHSDVRQNNFPISEIEEGLELAKSLQNEKYIILFQTLFYEVTKHTRFYNYLELVALPCYLRERFDEQLRFYGSQLIFYYETHDRLEDALKIMRLLVKIPRNIHDHEDKTVKVENL